MRCHFNINNSLLARQMVILAGLFVGILIFAPAQNVSAQSWMPVHEDFGSDGNRPNPRLLVGNTSSDGTRGIDAPLSQVKIYSTNPTIDIRIIGFSQCHGDGYDYLDPGRTLAEVYATDANETRTGIPLVSATNGYNCGSLERVVTATHPGPRSALIGHTQFYVFTFRASLLGSTFGWNTFRLNVPGAHIGYSDNSGERFAIKGQFVEGDSSVAEYATYRFYFGVPCEITTNVTRSLRWFDADQGEPNQARELSFNVYDETAGVFLVSNTTNVGGQSESRSLSLTFQPGHKYRWVWHNVSSHNGLQLQLPFDSIYYNTNCTPPVDSGTCSFTGVPASANAGQAFTVTFTVSNTGTYTWPVNNGSPERYRMESVNDGDSWPSPTTVEITGPGVTSGPALDSGSTTSWSRSYTAPSTAGTYTFNQRVFGYNSVDGFHTVTTCSQSLDVVERPYFRAYGGDVFVGAGFTDGTSCPTDQEAGIISWNNAAAPYTGSGSQLAVFSLGQLVDFTTGQLRDINEPNHLSFANVNPSYNSYGGGTYGGGLIANAGNAVCADDYFANIADATVQTSTTVDTGLTTGSYLWNGDIVFTGGNVGLGQNYIKYYVNGDVHITGNVTYADGNRNGIVNIPQVRIIARGNIYVAPNVTRLDGIYIAQPDPASLQTTGWFYTCWPGHIPTAADLNGVCRNNRLTVYGAVLAELIKFTRSQGSTNQSSSTESYESASGTPAEVFIYTPEVWLVESIGGDGGELDSITTLPPVL